MEADLADNFPFKDLTYKIIGALYKVQNFLGNSLEERYYHRALESEFSDLEIPYETEKEVNIIYKNKTIGKRKLDFILDNNVILEIKAVPFLDSKASTQLLSYLKSTGLKVGIVANFRSPKLTYKRIVNPLVFSASDKISK